MTTTRVFPKAKPRAERIMPTKRLKRPAPVFAILSRHITTVRGGKAKWGAFKEWSEHKDNALNIRDAMKYGTRYLNRRHVGTIVYITQKGSKEVLPIWEAKWGHDNQPYIAWKRYPVADYWRRRVEG